MSALSKYVYKLTHLKRGHSNGKPAPHKPILLLSIIEGIETGEIKENKIRITPELVARFKDYWHQLVDNPTFTANFSLPFYHLKGDGFWHLHSYLGRELVLTSSNSISSFAQLKQVIEFASFDEELFELLVNEHTRLILKQSLLTQYFAGHQFNKKSYGLVDEVINQILNDRPEDYKRKAENSDEEELFVRGGVFKKEVPKIYNYTCSISGLRIITTSDIQMIDACHIIPFSESHDDTVTNGISLCPNLHRAFDRGLISLNDDYRVILKPFSEEANSYSIKQFEGKQILLPINAHHRPSIDNFKHHRIRHRFE